MNYKQLDPTEEPQTTEHIKGFVDDSGIQVAVTRTTHGAIFEGSEKPAWVKYHVIDVDINHDVDPPVLAEDTVKSTSVLNENSDEHYFYKRKILAFAEGYWKRKKEQMNKN